jgi:hypothetical protein
MPWTISTGMTMNEKIFDAAFLSRLASTVESIEREDRDRNDAHPLNAEDYEVIYTAYADSGGDPEVARRRIATARNQRDQALGRILQFVSDQYGFGPIEHLDEQRLTDVARDAFDAAGCWMEDVERQPRLPAQETPLHALLNTHYWLHESLLDLHDEIFWPVAKRIFPRR